MTTTQEEYESRRMAVADWLLGHPDEFDMLGWGHRNSCGTTACIAGTAVLIAEREGKCNAIWGPVASGGEALDVVEVLGDAPKLTTIRTFAQEYLGLPYETNLFIRFELTNEQAAKELLEEPYLPYVHDES